MESTEIQIRTISPIYIPITLKTGIDRSAQHYIDFQKNVHAANTDVLLPRISDNETEYESIEKDSWDHQLFTWYNKSEAEHVVIHVFPNNIGIVVIDHQLSYSGDSKAIEKQVQQQSNECINDIYQTFQQSVKEICLGNNDYWHFNAEYADSADVFWNSRALMLTTEQLTQVEVQALTKQWLAHTYRPADSADIIAGKLNYSMTWLNYAIVDCEVEHDERLDSMILAQYYYAAQESCNKLLKQAIDAAYNAGAKNDAEKKLSRSRVKSRLHQVDYHEHLKYLTRSKRQILEGILASWNYEQISENGRRMIEICSSKIDETENKKRERSALLTDLLLVALSFFTVFELSLYLTELSREMMSRPTLDFNDDNRSFMLQFIAEIDTDVMFGSGFFLTLMLVFLYKFIKSR